MNTTPQTSTIVSSLPTGGLPKKVFAHGFSRRKLTILRGFAPESQVLPVADASQIPPGGTLLLWGSSAPPEGLVQEVLTIRLEDGFLRSVGLGADLIRPLSWVFDQRGIYYDATRPSDLEELLQTVDFSPDLLERSAALQKRLVESGLTKYNLGGKSWTRPADAARVILVPGQVESDASIRFGAPGISTNTGLLRAVRQANPEAWIVYKPHPDVLAGLRAKGAGEEQAVRWCDQIVNEVSMGQLLPLVDEVHLMTSLTGFEALLRGKRVVCYGLPFYAGWGLTTDLLAIARRTRRLALEELVAGALILYPRYLGRSSGELTSPELALGELLAWRTRCGQKTPLWRRALRVILRRAVGVR